MPVLPYPARSQPPAARTGAALTGIWVNFHSWHNMGSGSSEASENTVVHTTGRDPAPLFLSSVSCFTCMPPSFPPHHFLKLHHGTSIPGWPCALTNSSHQQHLGHRLYFSFKFFFCFIKILTVNTLIRKIEQVGNMRWNGEI